MEEEVEGPDPNDQKAESKLPSPPKRAQTEEKVDRKSEVKKNTKQSNIMSFVLKK